MSLILVGGSVGAAHESTENPPASAAKRGAVKEVPEKEILQKMTVPEYVSPLQSYKKFVESGEPDWKAANGLVGEIGGWRAYAKEAYLEARREREAQEKNQAQDASDAEQERADGEETKEELMKPKGESE